MGMAASQARYLGLTARKTNVEYEGQQINQARTALANQSANTFNELLALEVPTAPSTQDYTTLQYSYTDGTTEETITDMSELINDPDGYNYLITHYHYSDVYTGIQSKKTNPQVVLDTKASQGTVSKDNVTYDAGTGSYTVNGQQLTKYDPAVEDQKNSYDKIASEYKDFANTDISDIYTYTDADGKICFATQTDLDAAVAGTDDMKNYTVNTGVPTYVGNCEVSKYEPTENQNKLTMYNAQNVNTKIERQEKAFVDLDDSGRPQSIRFEDSSATFALSTETKTDENAYNDAMNQYNYEMQVYEKKIADINAKTEKIQEQDRTLELRLKQLDTEQEALQTEMESVKKVIDKNIESTFKTFE